MIKIFSLTITLMLLAGCASKPYRSDELNSYYRKYGKHINVETIYGSFGPHRFPEYRIFTFMAKDGRKFKVKVGASQSVWSPSSGR